MVKRGKQFFNQHMTLDFSFIGNRIEDGYFAPVQWQLEVDMIPVVDKSLSGEQATVSYHRISFWLNKMLPDSLIVNGENDIDVQIAAIPSNNMIVCPYSPSDDVLVRLLHSKLSILSEKNLVIGEVRLTSSDSPIRYSYNLDETGYGLPKSTEYYFLDNCKHSKPWWDRNDGHTMEFVMFNSEDNEPDDPLSEFKFMIIEDESNKPAQKEPAEIIKMEKWAPKKV